jgi:hypothetical protein
LHTLLPAASHAGPNGHGDSQGGVNEASEGAVELDSAHECRFGAINPVRGARVKLAAYHERYNEARPHWALVATDPATAPARILTPYEVYVKGYAVNPPSWSRRVGWLTEQDQEPAAQPPNRTASRIPA